MVAVAVEPALAVSAAAILIYDYFLTLSQEIDLIWPSQPSIVKMLFFLTRYTSWINVVVLLYYQLKIEISLRSCEQLHTVSAWLTLIGFLVAEVILAVRTWTLWNRSKRLAIVLGVMCISSGTVAIAIEVIFIKTLSATIDPTRGGCPVFHGTPLIAINFILVILYETGILVLTLIKGVQIYRLASDRRLITGLTRVLYRDGIIFYIYLFGISHILNGVTEQSTSLSAASIVNFITIITAPADKADMLVIVQGVLHSSLSARVILNLRATGRRDVQLESLSDFSAEPPVVSDTDLEWPGSSTGVEYHPLTQLANRSGIEVPV